MKAYQWLVVLAIRALAAPLVTSPHFAEQSVVQSSDGFQNASAPVGKTCLQVSPNHNTTLNTRNFLLGGAILKRQASPKHTASRPAKLPPIEEHPVISAKEASRIKLPGGGKPGVFYRGDSRPPEQVFASGFAPRGHDLSLQRHLSFVGESGLVSLSRSRRSAEGYAFGRTGAKTGRGYVYVVSPTDVPDGYWVPGLFPPEKNPAVGHNQEFAAAGPIPGSSISHAYEVYEDDPSDRSRKIKNDNYALREAPGCVHMKRSMGMGALCDPAKLIDDEVWLAKSVSPGRFGPPQPPGTTKMGIPGASPEMIDRPAGGKGKGNSSPQASRPFKPSTKTVTKLRAAGQLGFVATISLLAPYAHKALNALKEWDHPIGHGVAWFDDAINSFQESLGGKQVPEIYGNELKLRIICWIRGEQRFPNAVDRACQRLWAKDAGRTEQDDERDWQTGLAQLREACGKAVVTPPDEAGLRDAILKHCEALEDSILRLNEARTRLIAHREQVQEKVDAGGRVEPEDIDKAAEYISEGAFPSFPSDDGDKVWELAAWYMGDVKAQNMDMTLETESDEQPETMEESPETTSEDSQSAPADPPAWLAASRVVAGAIALDEAVGREVFALVDEGPYVGLFDEAPPHANETCYSPAGLARAKPGEIWDRISAALVYIEQNVAEGMKRVCKGCYRGRDEWRLACGSTSA
ncbi:hypothetical protein MANI_016364 [Metarhizium anisopliae]